MVAVLTGGVAMAAPSTGRLALLGRYRDFRRYWLAFGLSLHGTWIQTVAQGWLLHRLTGSTMWLGLAGFAGGVPWIPLVVVSGILGDRYRKRRLLIVTNSIALVQALALAIVVASGHVQVWHVIAAALVLGAANALESSNRILYATDLLPRGSTAAAMSLIWIAVAVAQPLGGLAGGLLIRSLGEAACFAVNGLTFLFLIGVLLSQRDAGDVPAAHEASAGGSVREVGDILRQRPFLVGLLAVTAATGALATSVVTFLPALARDDLHVGSLTLGLMYAAYGSGALCGAVAVVPLLTFGAGRVFVGAAASAALALVAVAGSAGVPAVMVSLALLGAAGAVVSVLGATLVQDLSPRHARARMASVHALIGTASTRTGALVIGAIAASAGLGPVVLGCGVALALSIPLTAVLAPSLLATHVAPADSDA